MKNEMKHVITRSDKNAYAEDIFSMAKKDALKEYEHWNSRWRSGETTEEVRYWRAQMFALANREEIDEHTLT